MPPKDWKPPYDFVSKTDALDMLVDQMKADAARHSAEMNRRCVENFNEAVARAEALEDALADECEIRRVLLDVFGHRSYCVTVERG